MFVATVQMRTDLRNDQDIQSQIDEYINDRNEGKEYRANVLAYYTWYYGHSAKNFEEAERVFLRHKENGLIDDNDDFKHLLAYDATDSDDIDISGALEGLIGTVDVIDKRGMKIHSKHDDGDGARQDAIDTASLDQEAEDLFLYGPSGKEPPDDEGFDDADNDDPWGDPELI
jgi:hypothetical protein